MDGKYLEDFLRARDIEETIIQSFIDEKISTDTINLMDDEELKNFLPKYGDRIALKDFCRRKLPTKKRTGLLNKLKKKLRGKQKMDGENAHSSDSAEGEELEKKDKTQKETVFRKNTRLIELGWMHSEDGLEYHQVRAKNGGGTRRISVPISSKRNDLISTAAQLFFPKGVSSKGPLEEFALDLRDYGQNIMSDNSLTVGDVLKLTGFLKLRFYLSTQKVIDVDKLSPTTENQLLEKFDAGSSKDEFVEVFNENLIDEEHPEIDLLQFIDTESNSVIDRDILVVSPIAAVSTAINNENIRLTLHRGRIFEELINAFTILDKNCPYLVIEIIMPNGKPEVGVDVGGVFRDAISEFWATFYDTCTIGAKSKIPFVRHDYGTEQWKAVARILYKGYKDEKYFPLKLARPFIESCITGSSTSSLYDSFLKYVSESDGHTITQAIQNFDSVEEAELQEVFENLESRWVPSISNIEQLVRDIAHKEIIQKPKFIIDCWHDELKDLVIDLDDVYRATEPNSKNILALLAPELEELTSDATKVFGYLKRFIREAEEDIRSNFLRFCTGADVLVGKKINVSFTNVVGFKRTPIAHTCNCLLELPLSYDSFPEFRSEFNNLLKSNVWIMDLV